MSSKASCLVAALDETDRERRPTESGGLAEKTVNTLLRCGGMTPRPCPYVVVQEHMTTSVGERRLASARIAGGSAPDPPPYRDGRHEAPGGD